MRKINLLALSVILTSRVYASSSMSSNYYFNLRRFFATNNERIDIRILPTVFLHRDVLEPDPVDFTIFLDGEVAILRIPLNLVTIGENDGVMIENIFPRNLIRNEPASELVYAEEVNKNVYILKNKTLNNIPNITNSISIYVDKKDPQNPTLEFLLRKNVKKTEEDIKAMMTLFDYLDKYGRLNVAEDLESFGFLIDKTGMEE